MLVVGIRKALESLSQVYLCGKRIYKLNARVSSVLRAHQGAGRLKRRRTDVCCRYPDKRVLSSQGSNSPTWAAVR